MENLPKRKKNRLQEFDYSTPNGYFVTICTEKRRNLFWTNVGAIIDRPQDVPLTKIGKIVDRSIADIATHYPSVSVDHYVIMPNHVHLLIRICQNSDGRSLIAPTMSTVVRLMKGAVSKQAGCSVWQKGFYDHVVRGNADYLDIWQYIEGNPSKWMDDRLYIGE